MPGGPREQGKEDTMPGPLFLHQLDEATSRGCTTPGCTHAHGGALFLTPRCHPGVGVRIEAMDDRHGLPCGAVVGLRCWRCQAPLVQVALRLAFNPTRARGHGGALYLCYSEGNLTESGRRCHGVQGKVEV